MKLKKLGALLLAVTMATGMMAGCGGKEKSDDKGTKQESGTEGGDDSQSGEVTTLTFYNADLQEDDPWTDPVAKALTEKTGVKLEVDHPVGEDKEKVALMIAEQKFPDMIYAKGDASSLIDAGVLIDMTDLIEKYGPNIKKMYGDEMDKLKHSQDDPSIYQLSSYEKGGTKYEDSGTAQVQFDFLKENDYKIPESLDEFEQMLKDYVAAHPKTEDGMDTIGLSLSASDWHWMITLGNPAGYIAAGAPDNGQWLVDENYNATYKFTSDKLREYFKWLNKLYNEGLLDPEFATQTHDDYIAKISSGRVVALLDTLWDYQDGEKILKQDNKLGKTYCGIPLAADKDIKVPTLMYQGLATGQGVGITTSCENPEAAIKFLDYICSDEGQVLVNWGIEGTNYKVDENGKRYREQSEIDASKNDKNYQKTTGVGFHGYPFPRYGVGVEDSTGNTYTTASRDSVIAEYNEEQKAACKAWGVDLLLDVFPQQDEFEVPAFSPIWAMAEPQELTDIITKLDEIAQPSLVSAVMAKEGEFDGVYDKMISDLEKSGMDDAQQMMTELVQDKAALVE